MKWIRRAGRWILFAIVFALCAAMFYLIAIMGDGDADSAAQSAPALAPAAAMENGAATFAADALESAKGYSEAPVMTLSSGWYLTGGEVRQWSERGREMREVRLHYTRNNGTEQVDVSTITPRDYLYTLLDHGYQTALTEDCTLLGQSAVMMTREGATHMHALWGEAVYQLEGNVSAETLRAAAGAAVTE